jgi:hypothetical protein
MNVFVGEGVSEGALVKVGVMVNVGRRTKVCVAAAPAVWATIVSIWSRSKVGGAYGVDKGEEQASASAVATRIASIR